jgi:hypothetical protein
MLHSFRSNLESMGHFSAQGGGQLRKMCAESRGDAAAAPDHCQGGFPTGVMSIPGLVMLKRLLSTNITDKFSRTGMSGQQYTVGVLWGGGVRCNVGPQQPYMQSESIIRRGCRFPVHKKTCESG